MFLECYNKFYQRHSASEGLAVPVDGRVEDMPDCRYAKTFSNVFATEGRKEVVVVVL